MSKPTDAVLDKGKTEDGPPPFIYKRIVHWGDTDPARIVFTARFLQYALDAIEVWYKETLGYNWYELNLDRGIGSPFRFTNLDFVSPLTPRHTLEIEVRVSHVGTTSMRFDLRGYGVSERDGRKLCFTGDIMKVTVDAQTLQKMPMPQDFRDKLIAAGWCKA